MSELARELGEAGGLDAPPSLSARLRGLLMAELERGAAELLRTRSGYGAPICIVLAPADRALLALCPAPVELRADPAVVSERTGAVVTATLEALVERSLEAHGDVLAALLEPPAHGAARAHDDPDPVRRMARRILQRLDGMG